MGEVYRARDTRLDRIVALKVITGGGAVDPDLRARFEREARAISSLNHPHICVLHDVGREQPQPSIGNDIPLDFLIMEYLEGETLADRLARRAPRSTPGSAPSMTVSEAVAVAIQVASALDAAHRVGMVHRDLKPGNVMLTKAAQVKLMDFGLARLTAADTGKAAGQISVAALAQPTVSTPLTKQGTMLGTLQYMSPEQLKGELADARSDIFAFGIVLYEMLSGRRPFEGKSQAALIGAILEHDPAPVASLQPQTPPLLAELIARCLAKDADGRWQSARDLMRQLQWIAAGTEAALPAAAQSPEERSRRRGRLLRTSAALVATAVITGGIVALMLRRDPPPVPVVARFTLDLPEGQLFSRADGRRVLAISRDGSLVVYVADRQLYLRKMHELTPVVISGTEGSDPAEPIFSPDGQSVAFWSDGAIKRVPVTGGTPVRLSLAEIPLGASWEDGRILLGQPRSIVEIPENGGAAEPLVTLDAGERARSPQLVARGRAVLFTLAMEGNWDNASIVVQELATGRRTVLHQGGTDARLLPTGHLVYATAATIFAAPFDETTLTVIGGPVPVQQGLWIAPATGTAQIAWSPSGTLVVAQGIRGFSSGLVWVDRLGKQERAAPSPRNYGVRATEVRLSPDRTRVATTIFSDDVLTFVGGGASSEVWVADMTRGAMTRLTLTGRATSPVWTPDGKRVCYDSDGEVFCQPADGSTSATQPLFKVDGLINTRPFSPDGRMLLETRGLKTGNDISIATLGPPVETRPLLNQTHDEGAPAISPDGRWLAYQSNESGRAEVYVRPFPAVDQGLWPISTGGGTEPRWAPDGRELFFAARSGGWTTPGALMSVPVKAGATFSAGTATPVLKIPAEMSEAYDVALDGRRFLFHRQGLTSDGETAAQQGILVVQNWFEELKARVPTRTAK